MLRLLKNSCDCILALINQLHIGGSGANAPLLGELRNAIVQPDRRSVQRTALRSTDHHFVRELVHEFQAELAGSGDYDGGSGDRRDQYNDPTVGSALPSRIRTAVAALRSARRRIVEDGGFV
jgi:hypothetical protein